MIWGISLILVSILAVPSLILSKKPNAAELLAKLEPYQGWIGLVGCIWGVWGIISAILGIGLLSTWPLWWGVWLAGSVVLAALGFMLGFGMINKMFLGKNAEAQVKAEALRAKIAPKQGTLGIVGIVVGLLMILISLRIF
jgi:hypothetical protein